MRPPPGYRQPRSPDDKGPFTEHDASAFDIDAWLDTHDDEPAREELEPDYSSHEAA